MLYLLLSASPADVCNLIRYGIDVVPLIQTKNLTGLCVRERKRAGWIMFKNDKCWHLCYNLFTPNASHYLWSLTRCLFLHLHFFLMENCSYKTLYNPKARSVAKDWSSSTRVTWGLLKTNGNFQFSKLAFCSNEAQQFLCAAAGIRQSEAVAPDQNR